MVALIVAVIAAYGAYSVLTPTPLGVSLVPSPTNSRTAVVTIHNPTAKLVTGQLITITAEVDVPNGHGGSTLLQSVPKEYSFDLAPLSSQQIAIPMNFQVLNNTDYDVVLHVDGGGQQTVTYHLP